MSTLLQRMSLRRAREADPIQRAVDQWMAQCDREAKRRTPAETRTHVRELRAEMIASLADRDARHGTDERLGNTGCLDGPRVSTRRGRGKSPRSLALIEAARGILDEIQPASVRAVCYKLFTLGLITSMVKNETNRVSTQLTWAREQNIIPWDWLVDETREAERVNAFRDPAEYVETVKRSYRRDRWADQPDSIEVWSEKGTIRGTLAPVLHEYGVTFRVMHGHGSATAVHEAAVESAAAAKVLTVFYLGDWDPSGMDMSERDLPGRLDKYGGNVDLVRLALTEQDTLSDLPSFAADTKQNDPRYRWFVDRYGPTCWELDALSPVILRERVEQAIRARIDVGAWTRAEITEAAEIDSLTSILNSWPGIDGRASKYSPPTPGPQTRSEPA